MSPEQAKEEPLDARSDLFSLGTLLYHLSTGELPYQGSNPSVILKNIIDNNALIHFHYDRSLTRALRRHK